jgi:hypothetical protein
MAGNEKGFPLLAEPAHSRGRVRKTAMPKPIRLLGASCMVLFFFLLIQFMRHPGNVDLHDKDDPRTGDMVRDPNLDGKAMVGLVAR